VGVVERFVFQHPDTHFAVARLRPEERQGSARDGLTTIVGALPGVQVGETLRLEGAWAFHQQHGREFRIARFEPRVPASADGIRRYLGSGLIKGVGPVMAARIVGRFGEETLRVIEESPERLLEVPGINRKRVDLVVEAWAAQREIKALMVFLQSHNVATGLAARIFRAYGAEALSVVRSDPYRMVKDVRGIGFRTADDLAMKLGLSPTSVSRYAAALKHVLSQASGEGHVYLPSHELLRRGSGFLGCPPAALRAALAQLEDDDEAIVDGDAVYLTPLFLAERHAARRLAGLRGASPLLLGQGNAVREWLARQDLEGPRLSEAQRDAVTMALREKLCILTGGPGVGKSTTVRGLVQVLAGSGIRFCLAAPTGRAARRLTEATGHAAQTIHRLLQFSPTEGRFTVNEENPLPQQFVVADEASMLDIVLFYNLIKALQPSAHLLLVGDADQLPSVGPGNVLRDLIASGVLPVVALRELFRQAQQSRIVTTAHQINAGQVPAWANARDGDLFLLREEDPDRAVETICRLVAERIPRQYGFDPCRDIQVISPMHRGSLGVARLNERLQERLNPERPGVAELASGGRVFRVGDRVMQMRNDYDRNVYNGDMGTIRLIDGEEGVIEVGFGEMVPDGEAVVRYDAGALDELVHAYAISVHKAQGSEFPCVILALSLQHRLLLQRHLLYTALTRAKRLCVIVGSPAAVRLAVATNEA
ncbi:MAG TPA: ATP-dependent RecD-like DNA helicase, partial [Chloroflexota bacterium]|nr:ATP-dependent RecD-like DNA helicase [Chloroflexota bacterium]